jgi:hypothetical protein
LVWISPNENDVVLLKNNQPSTSRIFVRAKPELTHVKNLRFFYTRHGRFKKHFSAQCSAELQAILNDEGSEREEQINLSLYHDHHINDGVYSIKLVGEVVSGRKTKVLTLMQSPTFHVIRGTLTVVYHKVYYSKIISILTILNSIHILTQVIIYYFE